MIYWCNCKKRKKMHTPAGSLAAWTLKETTLLLEICLGLNNMGECWFGVCRKDDEIAAIVEQFLLAYSCSCFFFVFRKFCLIYFAIVCVWPLSGFGWRVIHHSFHNFRNWEGRMMWWCKLEILVNVYTSIVIDLGYNLFFVFIYQQFH